VLRDPVTGQAMTSQQVLQLMQHPDLLAYASVSKGQVLGREGMEDYYFIDRLVSQVPPLVVTVAPSYTMESSPPADDDGGDAWFPSETQAEDPTLSWADEIESIVQTPAPPAQPVALGDKKFPWLWVGLGAVVVGGGAVYFVTRK
jgi:hypothetical protein